MMEFEARLREGIILARKAFDEEGRKAAADVLVKHQRETAAWLFESGLLDLAYYEDLLDNIGRHYEAFIAEGEK
jgi:hypothetical protein